MKKIKNMQFVKALVFWLICFSVAGTAVLAANNQQVIQTAGPLITPADPEHSTSIDQRIDRRKTVYAGYVNSTDLSRTASQCNLAQTAIGEIKTRDSAARINRTQIYTNLASRLNIMAQNLARQSVDNSVLVAAQKRFNNSINRYLKDALDYKTAMNDLVIMDCRNDPAGFRATLQEARDLRQQLANDSKNIKSSLPQLERALEYTKQLLIEEGND